MLQKLNNAQRKYTIQSEHAKIESACLNNAI